MSDRSPVILALFSIGELWGTWVNYLPGIYYVNFDGDYFNVEEDYLIDIETKDVESIGSVIVDGISIISVTSILGLYSDPSFYWDDTNKRLYVRLDEFRNPDSAHVKVGSNIAIGNDLYVDEENARIFVDDLKNIPPLSQSKDRIFFQRINMSSFTMELENSHFKYDDIRNWDLYNQTVQYYFGYSDQLFSQFIKIKSGKIRDYSISGSSVILNIQDTRNVLSGSIPPNNYNKTDYPDLAESDIGKSIPMPFGKLRHFSITVLNKEDISGPYICKLADTSIMGDIKAITQVYVEELTETHGDENLSDATFSLTAGQIKDGDQFLNVTVTFESYMESTVLIENPLDIIRLLLSKFLNITFNNANYNVAEWNVEKAKAPNVNIGITGDKQIKTIIEEISVATKGGFFDEGDNKYTFRTHNDADENIDVISDLDWIDMPGIENDTDEVLASVTIGYDKHHNSNRYKLEKNTEFETDVQFGFNIYDTENFNTVLKEGADAVTLGSDIMTISNSPADIFTGIVPLDFIGLQIGKNIQVSVNRFIDGEFVELYGILKCEILSVDPDIDGEFLGLTLRKIRVMTADEITNISAMYNDFYYNDNYYNAVFVGG